MTTEDDNTRQEAYMIGSTPDNSTRLSKLQALQVAGYRGRVSLTAYYSADIYEITDDAVQYLGRVKYKEDGWMPCNFQELYNKWITSKKNAPFTVNCAEKVNFGNS